MSKYADIIKRLEEADGPDRALDAHILVSVNGVTMHKDSDPSEGIFAFWQDGVCHNCTRWDELTASIDAAIALVERTLKTYSLSMGIDPSGNGASLVIWPNGFSGYTELGPYEGCATSLPVAILLALFRALEAKDEET
jgi:hypothetical protein